MTSRRSVRGPTAALAGVAILLALCAISGALTLSGVVTLPKIGPEGAVIGSVTLATIPLAFFLWWRWPVLVLCVYAALVPFDGLDIAGTRSLDRLLGVLCSAALAASILLRRPALTPPRAIVVWSAAIAWMALSLSWTESLRPGVVQVTQLVSLVGLAFIVSIARVSAVELKAVILATVLGGAGAGLLALHFYQSGSTFFNASGPGARVLIATSTEGALNPIFFASALILPTILAVVGALRARNPLAKLAFAGAATMTTIGILVAGSRGPLIALGAGFAYLLWRIRYRFQLVALAAAGLALSAAFPAAWVRFSNSDTADADGRYEIWKIGLRAFGDHWFVGNGMASFPEAYDAAYLKVAVGGSPYGWSRNAHNVVLQSAVELGIVGLVLVLMAWFVQLRMMRAIHARDPLYDLRCAIEASTVAIFVGALSADVMTFKYLWLTFYLAFLTRSAWLTSKQSVRYASATELESNGTRWRPSDIRWRNPDAAASQRARRADLVPRMRQPSSHL